MTEAQAQANAGWNDTYGSFWGQTFHRNCSANKPEVLAWWNQNQWTSWGNKPKGPLLWTSYEQSCSQYGTKTTYRSCTTEELSNSRSGVCNKKAVTVTDKDKCVGQWYQTFKGARGGSNGESFRTGRNPGNAADEGCTPAADTMFNLNAYAVPNTQGGIDWSSKTPYNELVKYYFQLKKAAFEIRTAVACVVNLFCDLAVAKETADQFAEAVQADPAATPEDKKAAQDLLDAIDDMEDNGVAGLTSSFTKNLIFREQCFLLAKVFPLSNWKYNRDGGSKMLSIDRSGKSGENFDAATWKRAPYDPKYNHNSSIILDDTTPYGFMNRLTQSPSQKTLFDLNNWDISSLQPMIKLFKIQADENKSSEEEVPITFNSHADISSLLKDRKKRGEGVGIQSFNFTYDGSNPFSAKKSIKAKLKIFANTFDELLVDRGAGSKKFRYVDLALKTSNTLPGSMCSNWGRGTDNEELAKLNFRLKAVVGWAYPKNAKMSHFTTGVADAVYNSYVTLNLTPTVHDFQIDEQGRVIFEINYLAYTDDFFDQKEYDIFNNVSIITNQIARKMNYNNLKRQCKADSIETLKFDEKDVIGEEKRQNVSSLLGQLLQAGKIYYLTANVDDIKNFQSKGPFYDSTSKVTPMTDEEKDLAVSANVSAALEKYTEANEDLYTFREELAVGLSVTGPNDFDLPYFYVSDLVDVILQNLDMTLNQVPKELNRFLSDGAEHRMKSGASGTKATKKTPTSKPVVGEYYQTSLCKATPDYLGGMTFDGSEICKVNGITTSPVWIVRKVERIDAGDGDVETLVYYEVPAGFKVPGYGVKSASSLSMYYFDSFITTSSPSGKSAAASSGAPTALKSPTPAAPKARTYTSNDMFDCDVLMNIFKYNRLAKEYKKFRVLLGPIEIVDRKNDLKVATINLADLPISVKYFIEFLTEKLSTKEESKYSLSNFLNDFFNNLVRNFLNDDTCFTHSINVSQKVRMTQAAITSYKSPDQKMDEVMESSLSRYKGSARRKARSGDVPIRGRTRLSSLKKPVLQISGERDMPDGGNQGFENEMNYMCYFAGRTQPREMMKGDRATDEENGIFHYLMGKDRGIVKNIQLSKTQTPGLQEVRFEQEGYDGLRQLRVVYDVNIDTYSNVKTFPGTYIYVEPRSFAPSTNVVPGDDMNLTEYGIGGYYMIIRSEHNFAPGDASSKIYAKWVNQLEDSRIAPEGAGAGSSKQARKNDLVGDASGCKTNLLK